MQALVAARFCQVAGQDAKARVDPARAGALRTFQSATHLAKERARSAFHNAVASAESSGRVCLNLEHFRKLENERLNELLANSDLEALVSEYPIKKTGAIDPVARAIGFNRREDYESSVLQVLRDHGPEWHGLRSNFTGLLLELGCTLPAEAEEASLRTDG